MSSSLKKYEVHLKGISPLITQNEQLADPLNEFAKNMQKINKKVNKSEEDILNKMKYQWEGGLYYDDELGLHIPTRNIQACLKHASKKHKGKGKATLMQDLVAILIDAPMGIPLIGYEGISPQDLWKVKNKKGEQVHVYRRLVVIGKAKVPSARAIFHQWALKFNLYLDTDVMSFDNLKLILETAGFSSGLCELRPQKATGTYGRFNLEGIKEI